MAYPNNGGNRNDRNPSPPPLASTPIIRRSRPRFATSGPPNYPRPRSSATKPNPTTASFSDLMRSRYIPSEPLTDSMMNNCGDSMQYMDNNSFFPNDDVSFASDYNSGDSSFRSQDSSVYYSCNESFGAGSPRKNFPLLERPPAPMDHQFQVPQPPPMDRPFGFQAPQQGPMNRPHNSPSGKNPFKAPSSVIDSQQRKPTPYVKKPKLPFRKSEWRCELCDIDFTSRKPFTMHFQGTKHAKKLKLQESIQAIQSQVIGKEIVKLGTTFRCDICGVLANGTFQLQTHLEGVKHKNKVAQLEAKEKGSKAEVEAKEKGSKAEVEATDANSNGAKKKEAMQVEKPTFTILPNDNIDVPAVKNLPVQKPAVVPAVAKPTFACVTCNVSLNSKHQYDQHLAGKYHRAKVEGKTVPYRKKVGDAKKMVFVKSSESQNPTAEVNATAALEGITEAVEGITEAVEGITEAVEGITEAVETPEIAKSAEPVPVNKPVVGILKNKNTVTPPSESENLQKPEPSSTVAAQNTESAAVEAQTVVGVKNLERSFVAGETLK